MSGWALAQTQYSDTSKKVNVDMSSGDLSTGATKNMIAGGNLTVDGLSEDLAKNVFSVVNDAYTNANNFIEKALGTADNRTQATVETVTTSLKEAYNSEQATINSFKTYALYAVIAFVAWAYLRGK